MYTWQWAEERIIYSPFKEISQMLIPRNNRQQEITMADNSYTEVTSESWFGRIKNAFAGILIGLILFIAAFPLLFWNEGRAVKTYKTLKEGGGAVISVAVDNVDPANADKLIHVTGTADTQATLTDSLFGVSVKALKLSRDVEMYQWKEKSEKKTKEKLGGGTETVTTYTYHKAWSDDLIKSQDFKQPQEYQNPGAMLYPSEDQHAKEVTLGAYKLTPSLVGKINKSEKLSLNSDTAIPVALQSNKVKVVDSAFYIGADPANPQIGDTRITFKVTRPTEVSVVAKQKGSTFEPYKTKAGGTIELLQTGARTAAEMFEKAQKDNTILTWILRVVGFVLMMIGLSMIMKPLSVLASVVPFLGKLVEMGTGLIAFLLAASFSLVTISIAWIAHRPLLGGLLIAGAVALVVVAKGKMAGKKQGAEL
jgi:Transmembrane protein 43